MNSSQTKLPPILAVGIGPIPPEDPGRLHLPGIRIWSIARELAAAGHPVRLLTLRFEGKPLDSLHIHELGQDGSPLKSAVRPITEENLPAEFLDEARSFGAAAAVGCMDVVNRHLGRMNSDLPIWCDYPGDPMAERQLIAHRWDSDETLADQWRTLADGLARADRVSGFSREQTGALAGQMAVIGRINRYTAGTSLIHYLPPWHETLPPEPANAKLLRGSQIPDGAFVLIQTGGFNNWLDVETLFLSLEQAMKARDDIHFAATGGPLPGHSDNAFGTFHRMVEQSPFRERFHLLGWKPLADVYQLMREADAAINVDRPGPEGWLGGRYRLVDWIANSLPVISTVGCELAEEMAELQLISGAPQGDSSQIAAAILRACDERFSLPERASRAREYFLQMYARTKILNPLFDWAAAPQSAPDLLAWRKGESRPPALWDRAKSEAERLAEIEVLQAEWMKKDRRIKQLEGSALVKGARWLRSKIRKSA
ncbi:hypothetical protein HYR69_02420 [Candidatus Sumerlaeota bacterium]|nr:hypothetical protein [Candidatus Sumerlaeota bacterium]MBI3736108.1 hypothetical protein [Candidatus Sumerlaeota bacterium]